MFRLALARRSNMYAVGRFLSQGVYTVAGPFHPFGGAVDIIVVQQQDGSYKSSPWYVKFGKFQGVLKRSEKVVDIAVNDLAVKFHMYLDSTGEAYFLKDSEPDKDPSSSQLAITAGDEVLTIEAGPSKLDVGLENKEEFADAKEDVEEAESSDEKDSNLELRFEGRKASYLLVQQARAAEEAKNKEANYPVIPSESSSLVEDTDLSKNDKLLEDCKLKGTDTTEKDEISEGRRLEEDAGIVGEIQHLEISTLENTEIVGDSELSDNIILKDSFDVLVETEVPESTALKEELGARGEASDDPLSSLAALKLRNNASTSVEELGNVSVGSAIHALFNQAVGLEEAQKPGRPSSTLIAQAAFTAVAKAALESGGEDSSEGLGNGTGNSFELLDIRGDATEGFRRRKSKSLNMGFEFTADEPVRVRRIKSESELRLLETSEKGRTGESDLRTSGIGDNSPELSTLMIASADGVVVLHTPRCGSPPPLTSQDDQTQQHPTILEGDGVEKPLVPGMLASNEVVPAEAQGNTQVEKADPSYQKKEAGALLTPENGGWKLWPFPLRRSKIPVSNVSTPVMSQKALLVAAKAGVDTAIVNNLVSQNDFYLRSRKNKIRSFLPTSLMLAEMNLKEGSNRITFTFQTRVLGKQQVDARIYLWKWNTRVVISDVDGTITKSDVLGQVMPLVGRDWTQSGVTRLFSAIKENGYEVMFLSARAISQAYLTRQFLVNLKQDGEALPDGPVVISPDGLFPSLYREVIRRAPHEFKIACLQDIRDLFPKDCNPFYAGFGNRDTDEISYLKVGIPKGKIFIINPKGEVAVNNRVDVKSYTSLHKLVDDMFPPQSCTEQEDFNSWNYWKMPLPDIEDEISVKSTSKPKKTK